MKKAFRGVAPVMVASLALLGACSDASGGGDSSEFVYWSMWKEGEPMQEVVAAAIADYEEETGVDIDVQWQGRDNVQRTVPTLSSNTGPDLVDSSYVKTYAGLVAANQAKGLADAWELEVEDGATLTDIIPSGYLETIDIMTEDGEPWMVPYTLTSDGIWFDANKHPELQESPPQTWDEFIDLLDEMKAEGSTPIALDGDIPGYNSFWFVTALLRSEGPGALHALASDESGDSWLAGPALEAAQKVQTLVEGDYFIAGYDASKFPSQQQKWADDNAELLFMGTWAPIETAAYASDDFEYASFAFPKTTGEHFSARTDFNGFSIPANAKNPDVAGEFAAFFLREKYQALMVEAGQLPMRSDIDPPATQAGVWAHLQEADGFHQQNDGVAFPGYNDTVFWAINDDLVLGKIDAEEFVQTMAERTQQYWEEQD